MAFTPRLTSAGISGNTIYETLNPYYLNGWGMPNCTAYAWSRFWECAGGLNGQIPNGPALAPNYNAEDWYNFPDGYPRGSTPQLGAIACYKDGDFSGWGHVCVLEVLNGDGTYTVSESALNGYYFRASHTIAANGDYGYGNYIFQGFIYNPYIDFGPGKDIWKFKQLIYKKKGLIL